MFVIRGPNGELIEDNQVIVVYDRIQEDLKLVDNQGNAFLVDSRDYPNVKAHDILTLDKDTLKPFTGV